MPIYMLRFCIMARLFFSLNCGSVGFRSMAREPVKKTRVVCMSHKEDLDGLASAALVLQATGSEIILVDYANRMNVLREVAADLTLKMLHICDLGLSKNSEDEFIEIMTTLRKRHVRVTYIDHHDISSEILEKLQSIKVKIIHDISECTAVQVYGAYRRRLPDGSAFIAACAAITDYMDDKPRAAELLQIYDRQFALISATVMTYNIVGHQKDPDYLLYLTDQLAELKFPHEMPDAYEHARIQVGRLADTMAEVRRNYKKMRSLAYMEVTDSGASGAVNFVLGFSGKQVGVAYKERLDYDTYAVSIRGAKSCQVHLGRLVNNLATGLGGTGGGHNHACGALIPKPKMRKFLLQFNKELSGRL